MNKYIILMLLLSGVVGISYNISIAQNNPFPNIEILVDEDALVIYVPTGRDGSNIVSLRGFAITGQVNGDPHTRQLSTEDRFRSILSWESIQAPICFIYYVDEDFIRPSKCPGNTTLQQELPPGERFWWDQQQQVALTIDYIETRFICGNSQPTCQIYLPTPTPTATATVPTTVPTLEPPTLTSSPTAAPIASETASLTPPYTLTSAAVPTPMATIEAFVNVSTEDRVNIRLEPNENSEVLMQLAGGSKIYLTGNMEGDWFEIIRIEPNSQIDGWVQQGYIGTPTPVPTSLPMCASLGNVMYKAIVNASGNVLLSYEANENSSEVHRITGGMTVDVLQESPDGQWARISLPDASGRCAVGWLLKSYLAMP
jgi:hypothetical protein